MEDLNFAQRLAIVSLRLSQNSCHLDTQVVMLLALSRSNQHLFCRELNAFLQQCKKRDGTVTLMDHTDAIRDRFGAEVDPGRVGSLGWALGFFTLNRINYFKVHQPEELARVFVVNRPVLIVDGIKTLKKLTRCSQFIEAEVGGVRVQFRLRAIGGHRNGHWTTFVDVNEGASKCRGRHIDVRTEGVHYVQKDGAAFTKEHRQKCYLYEFSGRLSDLPEGMATRLRGAAQNQMKQTLIKFLRNQMNPDATEQRKRLMHAALERANLTMPTGAIEDLTNWKLSKLVQTFGEVFDDDSKLGSIVRFFVQCVYK